MIIVIGILDLRRCDLDAAKAIVGEHVASVAAQPGCAHCSIAVDCSDPHRLHLTERWDTPEAFLANGKSPHQKAFSDMIGQLSVAIVDLRAWAADEWIDLLQSAPKNVTR